MRRIQIDIRAFLLSYPAAGAPAIKLSSASLTQTTLRKL